MSRRAKVESPTQLKARSWRFIGRKTLREFGRDQCTDLAAALTYYAVLALFPAVIALLSLVGLFGKGPKTVETIAEIVDDVGAGVGRRHASSRPWTSSLPRARAAGVAFVDRSRAARSGRRPGTSERSVAR